MTASIIIVHWNCQGFNAHGSEYIWSMSKQNDEMIQRATICTTMLLKIIVILNDGTGSRLNPIILETSSFDLSLVSTLISSHCTWYVDQKSTHGSDHFVVNIKISYKPMIYNDHFNSSNSNYKYVDREGFANACDKKFSYDMVSERLTQF